MADKSKKAFDIHRNIPDKRRRKPSPAAVAVNEELQATLPRKQRSGPMQFLKRSLISIILIVLAFSLIVAAWDAYELSKASKKMFGSGNLFSLIGGGLQSDNGRTNILLAGYSADDPGHSGATLTDSIMLISLSANDKTGYILSIPRDLWVDIPGYGHAKINEAYQDGERGHFAEDGYAPGGMGLLEKVVSDNFGVPIHYYALVDYAAFRDTVNAVGGITINIQSSDPRGIYDPSTDYTSKDCCALADYPNGPVTLNGKQALNLARARGDAYGSYGFGQADFDRTQHQRQMLLALRQKVASWSTILNPTKAGHVFDGAADNVKTDLDTGNVLPLFKLIKDTPDLKTYSLRDLDGKNYLKGYGGALIPIAGVDNFEPIRSAIDQLNQ